MKTSKTSKTSKSKTSKPVDNHSDWFKSMTKAEQAKVSDVYKKAANKAWITIRANKAAAERDAKRRAKARKQVRATK